MTRRLYDEDPYMADFEAVVTGCREEPEGHWLALDRSAFYPAGGGQPHDTGSLEAGGARIRVLDVQADASGEVWHRAEAPLAPGTAVRGRIDWDRRFDHMQQHAGEHILAGCVWELQKGFTHGLHIGEKASSIDVTLPGGETRLSGSALNVIELMANRRVQLDAPMRGWYPGEDELKNLPLRKAPTVKEHIRIVAAGDFEYVACGGTHPYSTGQIGLIKIIGCEPARGKMRLSFLCAQRAVRHYGEIFSAANRAAQLLSSPAETLDAAVEKLLQERDALKEDIRALHKSGMLIKADALSREAVLLPGGIRLIRESIGDMTAENLRSLAGELIKQEATVALLSGGLAQGSPLLFARHAQAPGDMAALLRACGARGGGRADYAQGSAGCDETLPLAEKLYRQQAGISGALD